MISMCFCDALHDCDASVFLGRDEEWLALFEVWQRVYPDRNMGHCMAEALERVLPGRAAAK